MKIGSLKHARFIAEYEESENCGSLPEDWAYLGSGWSRSAYLGPDGVVYKVGLNSVNEDERENVRVLKHLNNDSVRVADCTSWNVKTYSSRSRQNYTVVNAMPYIKGRVTGVVTNKIVNRVFAMEDCYNQNYIRAKDGILYIIDLGESRKRLSKCKTYAIERE